MLELENCIASVFIGNRYFIPELIQYLRIEEIPEELELLTPAEKRVLKLIAQNKTAKEIGNLLFVSDRTMEKHKSKIIKKLDLGPKGNSLGLYDKENENFLRKNT